MTRTVMFVLLVPALLAASALQPVTVLPPEGGNARYTGPMARPATGPGVAGKAVIGIIDTVGGTTMDWQFNGPAYRVLVNSPEYGMHVGWMYSASPAPMPDRNMRYNFYDYGERDWVYNVPGDFMASGIGVYMDRAGFGNLDADPSTGVAVFSAHMGSTLYPEIARDLDPGSGLFEYTSGSPNAVGYQWPYISVGANSTIHVAMTDNLEPNYGLFYSKVDPWGEFSVPVGLAAPQPNPHFTSQNVAASKLSNKVCVTWEHTSDNPDPGFYRISNDGGMSWDNPKELVPPEAYGVDTITSFHLTSLFPFYDLNDELHIVSGFLPFVEGQGYIIPAQIWHWSESNTPNWNHIHTAGVVDSLHAEVGYNALFGCRASMGTDANGNLFVAWEQFKEDNVEPQTARLRADIYYTYSRDNGKTWAEAMKITESGTVSHRFPSIMDYITDTVAVAYVIDQCAGFTIYDQGPTTNNPYVVQRWENPLVGVAEQPVIDPPTLDAGASPNPFVRGTRISYTLPRPGDMDLAVYDAVGRPVRNLGRGRMEPGRYSTAWDGRDETGKPVAAGVYIYRLVFDHEVVSGKLLLTD